MSQHCPSLVPSSISPEWRPRLLHHLHLAPSLEPHLAGEIGRTAFELHEAFLQQQIPSLLVATTGDRSTGFLPRTREYPRRGPTSFFYSPALARDAEQLLADSDILHGHGLYVATNWILSKKGGVHDKPIVYHPHGLFDGEISGRAGWKRKLATFLFEGRNFKDVCLWRALNDHEADQIRSQGITAPIVIAPNGIRLDDFDNPGRPAPKNGRRRLLCFTQHQGCSSPSLLRAWHSLAPNHRNWELTIVGFGASRGNDLRVVERRQNIRTSFITAATASEKVALLKSADLFVSPSDFDPFCTGPLEAMACRVPALVSNTHPSADAIAMGCGFTCTAEDFRQTLDRAMSASPSERQDRGKAGRRLVESRYSWATISTILLDACDRYCR